MRETPIGFEKTVAPLMGDLGRQALRLTHNEAEADDLVQETLLRAHRFWHTFTPGTGAKAWLFTVMRNTHYTRVKRANKRTRVEQAAEDFMPEAVALDDALGAAETAHRVREAIAQLPEAYRAAVELADLEGYSYREVAETLGCPQGTVMSRLYRGRKQLAELLSA